LRLVLKTVQDSFKRLKSFKGSVQSQAGRVRAGILIAAAGVVIVQIAEQSAIKPLYNIADTSLIIPKESPFISLSDSLLGAMIASIAYWQTPRIWLKNALAGFFKNLLNAALDTTANRIFMSDLPALATSAAGIVQRTIQEQLLPCGQFLRPVLSKQANIPFAVLGISLVYFFIKFWCCYLLLLISFALNAFSRYTRAQGCKIHEKSF